MCVLLAEGAAVFSKTLVTFFGRAFASSEWALVAFVVSQAAYALATFVVFWNFNGGSTRYILLRVAIEDHGQ